MLTPLHFFRVVMAPCGIVTENSSALFPGRIAQKAIISGFSSCLCLFCIIVYLY